LIVLLFFLLLFLFEFVVGIVGLVLAFLSV
jgi:hypothetical protein